MTELQPGGLVELEHGVRVQSVGVGGRADEVTVGPTAGQPVRDAEPDGLPELLEGMGVPGHGAAVLGAAAENAGMRRQLSVPLDDLTAPPTSTGQRGDEDTAQLLVSVPTPEEDEGQALLEIDDTGVLRWHFAVEAEAGGGVDRAEDTQTFRVPIGQFDVDSGGERGILSYGVRKVLHLVRFPVERAAGAAATAGVGWWERRHRAYGLHRASAAYFAGAADPVPDGWFAAAAGQPVLLLVHGTFSVGRSAFAGLGADRELLGRWAQRYGDRIAVFDHPSLHVDPAENVRTLLSMLPADGEIVVDIVAHSRGGLVARQLGAKELAAAGGRPAPVIRRLVHVATPNAGTVLASKKRLGDLLDVFTNVVSLFTDEGSGTVVAAVLEVVKQVAVGALGGLGGLAAMDPDGAYLQAIDSLPAGPAGVHAMTSNYHAAGASVPVRVLDVLTDALFGAPNDLVVPTEGVYSAGTYLIDKPFDLSGRSPAVAHTGFFREPEVRRQLDRWLTAA
jgi:hypothetical protein